MPPIKSILIVCCLMLWLPTFTAFGQVNAYPPVHLIESVYHSDIINSTSDISSRIETISAQFLGKPYLLGALGEGPRGDYDRYPLYRDDAFDCETFVDTVLALAFSHDFASFKHYIKQIRYQNGQVDFLHRNHFTNLDWNNNNQAQGFIQDITLSFHDKHNQPVAKLANTLIDKASWYQHFSSQIIRISDWSATQKNHRLISLKEKGSHLPSMESIVAYIPLTRLINQHNHPNHYLFNQIPNGAIVEIVRPNWDLRQRIGTRLDISHLGFAIWVNGTLMFRQASQLKNAVIDSPLFNYLLDATVDPSIKGINIQQVVLKI